MYFSDYNSWSPSLYREHLRHSETYLKRTHLKETDFETLGLLDCWKREDCSSFMMKTCFSYDLDHLCPMLVSTTIKGSRGHMFLIKSVVFLKVIHQKITCQSCHSSRPPPSTFSLHNHQPHTPSPHSMRLHNRAMCRATTDTPVPLVGTNQDVPSGSSPLKK